MTKIRQKVYGIVGMPGAGKTTAVNSAKELGVTSITMGDVVREEADKRGLKRTRQNMLRLMFELRTEGGSGIIAKKCVEKVRRSNAPIIVIDGLRCQKEVEIFREEYPDFQVISIHVRPKIRYERLKKRGRTDDPKNINEFNDRDMKEINIGIAHVIALADEVVVNEKTISDLRKMIAEKLGLNVPD
ncbi:MAG: AAA family ATPase [Candidatus Ranarchaeia archaeon]